jgi:hypothetical protein
MQKQMNKSRETQATVSSVSRLEKGAGSQAKIAPWNPSPSKYSRVEQIQNSKNKK